MALDLLFWLSLPEPPSIGAPRSGKRSGGNGGGRGGKNNNPNCDDDGPCEKQLDDDLKWCAGSVRLLYGNAAYGACKSTAYERYSQCLSGKKVTTPLYGRDVH